MKIPARRSKEGEEKGKCRSRHGQVEKNITAKRKKQRRGGRRQVNQERGNPQGFVFLFANQEKCEQKNFKINKRGKNRSAGEMGALNNTKQNKIQKKTKKGIWNGRRDLGEGETPPV